MNPTETRQSAQRAADQGRRQASSSREHAPPAHSVATESVDNGPAAAAILAAGIGCFAVGLFALAGDASKAIAHFFTFYKPTGPLSGVTTSAIVVWLLSWFVLSRQWGKTSVTLSRVIFVSFVLLALSVLLTFPPFMDLLQGK
ncbi:hypothetical protein WJ47_34510 [Burkholderia ubonensis]|uniref:Uncharacterized protein n=1 Tax=Burkholderia ubonensis TaxID=101571 RepID=A0A108C898_9BURK|nr:hypothetical protein [Burkholderia ubonensis]KVK90185.1 hypothetical protein WJ44_26335 [Burkholderia ubonensis]KVL75203.1 hypothetical protein WJ47_34510 [Burkholderia ubonensis]KVM33907.1 hypothetical protein WJ54_06595 [Burkholderia ubonensis]KVM36449.1 hypothetical protein WJ53_31340 [Burkholderia ubonensis]KWK69853.1 hypothetical protein WM16_21610 [Burkholderia ubonensis]